ncbi:MAG: hypothetical protein WKF89_15790 [Chitinophagaceae bacterium]
MDNSNNKTDTSSPQQNLHGVFFLTTASRGITSSTVSIELSSLDHSGYPHHPMLPAITS